MGDYNPRSESRTILDRAMEHIQSVNYRVSLRWVFYRLLQDGIYKTKEDYRPWKELCADARRRFFGEWRPWTLMDETRRIIQRGGGFADVRHFKKYGAEFIANQVTIEFNHFYQQKELIFVGFEARAMIEQFEFYSHGIDLFPFGGDPSIPFKWDISKHITTESGRYELPNKEVLVLYFGDRDDKGEEIFKGAEAIIREWCKTPIRFEWCGLIKDQVAQYHIPENPEKPGQYQWEALSDPQAKEIIEGALRSRLDLDLIKRCNQLGDKFTKKWRTKIKRFCEKELSGERR